MSPLAHTPYDGSGPPFQIAAQPMALDTWLERDADFAFYQAEKRHLYDTQRGDVFYQHAEAEPACREVLALVLQHLGQQDDGTRPHLWQASLLVQEDLVIMQRLDEDGGQAWRLSAASLSFPSSWRLREKAGRALDRIHDTVPGFGPGSRNMAIMERMFDHLKVEQPIQRLNWSLQTDTSLHHPQAHRFRATDEGPGYIRVERQTLRKLPQTNAIVFTIRIYLDPLAAVRQHPALARGLADQIEAMTPAQLTYKGMQDLAAEFVRSLRKPSP